MVNITVSIYVVDLLIDDDTRTVVVETPLKVTATAFRDYDFYLAFDVDVQFPSYKIQM